MLDKVDKAVRVARTEGGRALFGKALGTMSRRLQSESAPTRRKIHTLVKHQDALEVDWTEAPQWGRVHRSGGGPYSVAWITSPPGESSGGHQNIFRFIKFMEEAGHRTTIYLYSSDPNPINIDAIRRMLASSTSYAKVDAPVLLYTDRGVAPGMDAIFATGWETAYPAFRDSSTAERFYFVQDFEPYFYPVGSESVLAENTYRFGFKGITAGAWLSTKLADEYGMLTDHFDFGADGAHYHLTNEGRRKEIIFYARPVTPRRGFELGIMALEQFARQRPDYIINMLGWDVSDWDIPFPHVNLSSLPVTELNAVFNRCAAGLVMSLTNMSLMPLELLASGAIPVVNKGENNRLVSENPFIEYSDASPRALARKLVEVVDRPDLPEVARRAAQSVTTNDWPTSGRRFVEAFERFMRD